ncbi:LON peptidase N-terminal domain and RING finger protein 3 [Dendrobium catenatum]|uniref:RING-type domain-containing protein n=1 Tax=Dendrobium catenatum TaxID=906689 RepID=A0A2I0X8Y8_9ASPA|nr:LON peptidase N-terminal domain and RING finger protein 3 [Dendrobium catenatum]PKU84364.1 hypothetical protein MA16_Dca002877 [Dendrobium catenatum]
MEERNSKAETVGHVDSLEKTFKGVIHEEHIEGRDVNWKSFKDGMRMHRVGNAWAAAVAEGANGRARSSLGALARTTSLRAPQKHPAWGDEQDEAVTALLQQRPPTKEQSPKISLMTLLADGGRYSDNDEEEGYEEEKTHIGQDNEHDDDAKESEGDMVHTCCVCMVRHKCASFMPCGHTFCRLCSKELLVSRQNCPVCNGFILELLNIF